MKKTILITMLVLLALAALGVGVAFAQGAKVPVQSGMAWMHEYIEQALAAKLGLSEEQVEEQFAAGNSMSQIALNNGIAQVDLATFMNEVHQQAFSSAVKDGVISQEQADWMLQRMQNWGFDGTGNCPMHGGQGRYGLGMMGNGGAGMMWGQRTQNP
jgi:hypothetical protein